MTDNEKTALYEEYYPKVKGYISGKIYSEATAEDLTSDVFVKVLSNIDRFDRNKASVSTWIYTITRNTVTDYFRTAKYTAELSDDYSDMAPTPEDEYISGEMLNTLADALESLPEKERKVIILTFYSGKSLPETADLLGMSYSYAKYLKAKALTSLKKIFNKIS